MAGLNTNALGNLFSGFSSGSSVRSASNLFSGTNYISDYYSIRNGSYKKLLNTYYEKFGTDDKKSTVSLKSVSNTVSKDSTAQLANVKNNSSKLSEAASALMQNGNKSLFKEVEVTDADGNKTMGYDTDKIYSGVKSFVDNYNSTIKSADSSSVSSITRAQNSMVSATKANSKLLEKIGITINKDNTLSMDEDKFKQADMNNVKSLFNSAGSYGYSIVSKASQMNATAAYEASKTNTYTSRSTYSSSFTSGSLYDSLF